MRSVLRSASIPVAALLLSACAASGPTYHDMSGSFPLPPAGTGRVFFYRSSGFVGAAVRPSIHLNDAVVGKSVPGGFFYVDRAPGTYVASCTTEVESNTSFGLEAGTQRYVDTEVSMGAFVGHVIPKVVDPSQGVADMQDLHYTGAAATVEASAFTTPPASATAPAPQAPMPPVAVMTPPPPPAPVPAAATVPMVSSLPAPAPLAAVPPPAVPGAVAMPLPGPSAASFGRSPAEVKVVLDYQKPTIDRAVAVAVGAPVASGSVVANFTVEPEGRIDKVSISSTTFADYRVGQSVAKTLQTIQLQGKNVAPLPVVGYVVKVN